MREQSSSATDFNILEKDQLHITANENMGPPPQEDACLELEIKDSPAVKLRLELKNGNRCFFPYAYMLRAEYDTKGVLTIFTSEQEIIIKGRGLDYIEDRLYDSQVKSIKESRISMDSGQGAVFVNSIEIFDRNAE